MIYMDYSATTYVKDEVLAEMTPFFKGSFGNASSVHKMGREARNAVDLARRRCAKAIGAGEESEIIFTSGGTESNNLAIRGVCKAVGSSDKKHIITSAIEHPSVLNTFKDLEREGFEVSIIPVDKEGIVKVDELKKAIRSDTVLVSIMFANNEVGSIQPVKEIASICNKNGILFHTDAVQAVGNVQINVYKLGVDLMSVSGHKVYAPQGVGFLYVKKGVKLSPIMTGGKQEKNKRPGTENVPGIVGLGKAMELAAENTVEHSNRIGQLRDRLINGVLGSVPCARLNGSINNRLCNNANICFDGVDGEALLINLDMNGICASIGSACSSGSINPSHVLMAMGLSERNAKSSIRFSLGDGNTANDIDNVIKALKNIVDSFGVKYKVI